MTEICKRHPDCFFLSFTNATLIDEGFAKQMLEVKNFVPSISIEGTEETTDARRGRGTYRKVLKAMDILRENKLPFGVSVCYTSQNYKAVTDEAFIDMLIDEGAKFAWFFHYMPVGKDAVTDLICTPEERETVYKQIRKFRITKPIFTMDFQNDTEYVNGCIAVGKDFA